MAHIILQAPRINSADIERMAATAYAEGVQELAPTVIRLLNVDDDCRAEVAQMASASRMDFAWLDTVALLSNCRLLAMDMDSTLINIECIDEIADIVGKKDQVAAITAAAMRGDLTDFSASLRQRVALLKDVPESALEQVFTQRLRLNPGAEKLIGTMQSHGVKTLLVSGGFTYFTERLRRGLALDYAHANQLEIVDGKLTGNVLGDIVDGTAKANYVKHYASELNAKPEQIIVIGDGSNDVLMMDQAFYSVAYRAKPLVQDKARYAFNVSPLDAVLNLFRLRHG